MIDPDTGLAAAPRPTRREIAPWTVAFVVLIVTLFSFALIGPFIGLAIAYPFYDGKPLDFINDISDPVGNESMKILLMVIQGCATLFGLAVIPPLFWKAMRHRPILSLFEGTRTRIVAFLMVIGIVIFFNGPNSVFMDWNSHLDLPDGAFETWAKDLETRAGELTKYLTSFTNVGQYLIGVLVIALLPAIGEELVFRGLLQSELQKAIKNPHIGIWLSAIFFSALHLQFYGFVPRVLLGALFGYLYYWSGNLSIAMFAHFVNNFFAVTLIYTGMSDLPGMEVEDPSTMPWYAVVAFSVLCGVLLYTFWQQFRKEGPNKSIPLDDISA